MKNDLNYAVELIRKADGILITAGAKRVEIVKNKNREVPQKNPNLRRPELGAKR